MKKTTSENEAGPALIVTHGSTKTKRRPLSKDIVVIGRGPACDIGLVSPEVAHVHCVVFRQGLGWAIRDCSGRATRVNGETITERILRDGDSIQIGTFSFEASLPGSSGMPVVAVQSATNARTARLERSRQRLGALAIRLRGRLREMEQQAGERDRQAGELDRLEQKLRNASQDHRARQAELDAYSRHLRKEVEKCRDLEREMEAELVRGRVEILEERKQLRQERDEIQGRLADAEATAAQLTEALETERAALQQEREQLAGERAYLDQQRMELVRLREAGDASSQDTRMDGKPDRLESARKLLKQLADKRSR